MNHKALIKLILSIALLVIIFRLVDLEQVGNTLRSASLAHVILIVVLYAVGQLLSATKWWLIAKTGGVSASFLTAIRAYYIGMYVNCFGLGMVGGDVARGLLLADHPRQRSTALISVLADRLHGLAILSYIGLASAILLGGANNTPVLLLILIACAAGITLFWFLGPIIVKTIFSEHSKTRERLDALIAVFPSSKRVLLLISSISFFFHLLQISMHAIMAAAIGVLLPWKVIFSVIPLVNILSSLPISWNGLGVRENAYRFFLGETIITPEQAVAFGALWLLAVTLSSLLGGVIAFFSGDLGVITTRKKEQISSIALRTDAEAAL